MSHHGRDAAGGVVVEIAIGGSRNSKTVGGDVAVMPLVAAHGHRDHSAVALGESHRGAFGRHSCGHKAGAQGCNSQEKELLHKCDNSCFSYFICLIATSL